MESLLCVADIAFGSVLIVLLLCVIALFCTVVVIFKAVFAVVLAVLRGMGSLLSGSRSAVLRGMWGPQSGSNPQRHDSQPQRFSRPSGVPTPMASRICAQPRCGHRNRPEAVFCANCGRRL